MRRLTLLLPLALLAACDDAAMANLSAGVGDVLGIEPPPPEAPLPLPPVVAAALPPGTPSSLVFTDNTGCYLFSVERTDPPSGYPVRDAAGNQICEGGATVAALPQGPEGGA